MGESKMCRLGSCCWDLRHEILGVILLVIATYLTIVTYNSFGIVTMFVVGAFLCGYRCGIDQVCCAKGTDEKPGKKKSKSDTGKSET